MTTTITGSSFASLFPTENQLPFICRTAAGSLLGHTLLKQSVPPDCLVLAIPRGGVPVAAEIARVLRVTLDVFLIRKIAHPSRPELSLGTLSTGGLCTLDPEMLDRYPVTSHELESTIARERAELNRRELSYRQDRPPLSVSGQTVILVDDGLTTGTTMRNAATLIRQMEPARVIAAVPVASAEACAALELEADSLVCAHVPSSLGSVRRWYRDFSPVMDREIRDFLAAPACTAHAHAFRA
ncbi:MAG: phosphoribosyltransferase [Acidobacteriota bacterium]|nr:phosphoribosyltransferase [Acidobacteriota bacterium]